MKILYVCSDLGIPVLGSRGGSIHVRSLVTALARAGHEVVLASPTLTRTSWERPAKLDVPILHIEPTAAIGAATRAVEAYAASVGAGGRVSDELRGILYASELGESLLRRFRASPPDVVYERAASFGTAGATIASALGVPLLLEVNAPLALEERLYRGQELSALAAAAERWMLARAGAVIVVSAALGDYVASAGVPLERIHVMPNGVDGELFRPAPRSPSVRARWDLDGEPVIGFVGGYQPWHGVAALPALVERLLPMHPNLRLLVVGDGRGRESFEREVAARGLDAHVRVTGAVPHDAVPELIREFDVALAPYPVLEHDFYFSPLKLFEYMGCAAPIVAPRAGQIADVIRDGETGLLYPPSQPDALAEACDRLLADRDLGRRLGLAAAADVRERYTWSGNASRVAAIAERVIGERAVLV